MTEKPMTKVELLTRMQLSWDMLYSFIDGLTAEQLTAKTDAAGWTVKDHLMHLAVWEDGFVAVLDGENRRERMGAAPEVWHPETWHLGDFDDLNAAIQQQHKDKTMDEVRQAHADIHTRLVAHVQAMTDADLLRPTREFDATSTSDYPIIAGIIGNSYGHYGEHLPWMDTIANGENHPLLGKEALLARIEKGWSEMQAYLATLSYEQAVIPTDAAGWTVKDHLAHLAVWEDGINALLDHQSRAEHMGITQAMYETGDYDAINEVIRQQNKDIGLMELRDKFFAIHARLTEKVAALYDSDLQLLPYKFYQPGSTWTDPVIRWIKMNTYEHYAEHTLWIAAIAAQYQPTVTGLLESIKRGWDILNDFLASLDDAQLTRQTDANGWTVKDHAIHLAIWERGLSAVLDGGEMAEAMGVDAETWQTDHPNGVNAVIQRRYKDASWEEVEQLRREIHQRLIEQVAALTDADMQRPVSEFNSSGSETPIAALIAGNTFAHYSDQLAWMEKISMSNRPVNKAELLENMNAGWDELMAFVASLTPEQLAIPTDAAGWTVKDHLIHLAAWQDGVLAMLEGGNRAAAMGLTQEVWDTRDLDVVNAHIQQQNKDKSADTLMQELNASKTRFFAKVATLSEADFQRQNLDSASKPRMVEYIIGDSYEHYRQHIPWMQAIAESAGNG